MSEVDELAVARRGVEIMVAATEAAIERERELAVRIAQLEAQLDGCRSILHSLLAYLEAHRDERPEESLAALLAEKREWSERTFGPGLQTESIVAHVRKECDEVLAAPTDTAEHIDIALLAYDLYWRAGGCDLLADLWAKHRINVARQWRVDGTGPVEHVE